MTLVSQCEVNEMKKKHDSLIQFILSTPCCLLIYFWYNFKNVIHM